MKELILCFLFFLAFQFANSQQVNFCFNYDDNQVSTNPVNSIDNWQSINGQFEYSNNESQNGSSDIYLRVYDRSGSSWAYNNVDFSGDWSPNGRDKCLCYDFRIYRGVGDVVITPTSMYIYNGTSPEDVNAMAVFNLTNGLTVDDGWVTICPPLQFADGNDNLPSNSDGQWAMRGGGTATDWDNLLQNVSGIALRLDLPGTANPSEIYGYDNICMKACPESHPAYDIAPCCAPFNTELLANLFDHVPLAPGLDAPFKLSFNDNAYFANLWQNYLEYLHALDNSIDKLVMAVRLIDANDSLNPDVPKDQFNPLVNNDPESQGFIWFEVGGNGNIFGNTNLFVDSLKINHWYKIHTGIYTDPGENMLKDCEGVNLFYRIQVSGSGMRTAEFSDGRRAIRKVRMKSIKKDK